MLPRSNYLHTQEDLDRRLRDYKQQNIGNHGNDETSRRVLGLYSHDGIKMKMLKK